MAVRLPPPVFHVSDALQLCVLIFCSCLVVWVRVEDNGKADELKEERGDLIKKLALDTRFYVVSRSLSCPFPVTVNKSNRW